MVSSRRTSLLLHHSTPPSTPNKKKSPSGGVIAGAIIAVIAGLGILAALAFFLLRHRHRIHAPAYIEPLVVAPTDTTAQLARHPSPRGRAPRRLRRHHSGAKTYDTAWNNPTTPTPYTSAESVVSPSHSVPPNAASTDAVSAGDVASITSAALEVRLATLEAQVSAHLPPVYEGRGGVRRVFCPLAGFPSLRALGIEVLAGIAPPSPIHLARAGILYSSLSLAGI
ncbi:hypothetical protein C8J57DRAFT_1658911 [Mycena rebaudengoi]|nr:hypothetical protein C8J57DRAFT_1658911 [Mycena rebaudengoi]